MLRFTILALIQLVFCVLFTVSTTAKQHVLYHISFDDLSFLEDCYVARSGLKTPEERKLELVGGRYGKALYLGAVPLIMDDDNMSGIDLDLVTAVIYNVAMAQRKGTGYDEPFIWGAGKLHPGYGAVAFWIKGPLRPGVLFNQSSSAFGRTEKELIEVRLEEDGSLSAYVEDARYVQHTVRTKPVWKPDTWMHMVFQWDKSSGVALWIDGEEAATTMGNDAWWENQRPGLFHLPMSKAAYDEFYSFDRPLTEGEIKRLFNSNDSTPSKNAPFGSDGYSHERLRQAYCVDTFSLPSLDLSDGSGLVFRQITPERIHDEGVSGWWLADGRYECAWPHEYALFTIVPGDADYHADHADILPPKGADVNYITLEGNLKNIDILKGDRTGNFTENPVSRIHTAGFFHGFMIDGLGDGELRVPFTKEFGTPRDFGGEDITLPLSGDVRLHEIGLFNVSQAIIPEKPGDIRLYLNSSLPAFDASDRYAYAFEALCPLFDRESAVLTENFNPDTTYDVQLVPMWRRNLFSEPFIGKTAIDTIILDLWVTSDGAADNILTVSVPNPAIPSQVWTHAEMLLEGLSGIPQRLRLALEFDPLIFTGGDRLWLQLMSSTGLEIITNDIEQPSTVILRPALDRASAEYAFSHRTMQPAIMTYSKMFEYMPWRITGRFPDVDKPENFGGPFDMVYPWQAVLKVNPGDRLANIYRELVTHRYDSNSYPPKDRIFPPIDYNAPVNAPDWAVYFRDFQTKRERIVSWWSHHQRSDGQVGGGWNDDTLVFSSDHGREGGYSDMILDSYPDALELYNNVFDGFDGTGLFKDGYCRIHPIDRLHNGDFIRERYKSLIYNLGDPRSAVWAMEEAWHYDKPDRTPVNYGDGSAFLFGKNVLDWYRGRKRVEEPYKPDEKERVEIIETLRRASESFNDTVLWRFTEARVHTDDQSPYGSDIMHRLLDGSFGVRERAGGVYYTHVNITLGLGWPEGGGADLARFVEYSGNDGLAVKLYSFDSFDRKVTARLYRLDPGEYTVTLRTDGDGDGVFESTMFERQEHMRRFGMLTFAVPPKIPSLLEVTQTKRDPNPGDLPDLAISPYYIRQEGDTVVVTVHNIGCASSGPFTLTAYDTDGGELKTVDVRSLEAPLDYVPRHTEVRLTGVSAGSIHRIEVDKNDAVREIFEENNVVGVNDAMDE